MNTCSGQSLEYVQILVEQNLIETLVDNLAGDRSANMITEIINALKDVYNTLEACKEEPSVKNTFLIRLEECNGRDVIEKLQHHTDQDVCKAVSSFIMECLEV